MQTSLAKLNHSLFYKGLIGLIEIPNISIFLYLYLSSTYFCVFWNSNDLYFEMEWLLCNLFSSNKAPFFKKYELIPEAKRLHTT